MQSINYTYLKFISFKDVSQWDLKRYFSQFISSKYPIKYLREHIHEEKQKFQISDKNCDYGILGVNNHIGIFDAYVENGSKIKQKYKKMYVDWIAYNPYRVNVGSIGIKKGCHKHEYISPAYVVFSCHKTLLPDYLFLLMKTSKFNQIIRNNTTGSVRQNLSYDILKDLQIPLPSIEEQKALVTVYDTKITQATQLEKQATEYEAAIGAYLSETLGINSKKQTTFLESKYKFLKVVGLKDVDEWGIDKIQSKNTHILHSDIYQNIVLGNHLQINPTTSFKELQNNTDISFIPMECVSDEYGIWEEKRICKIENSRGYTKFQEGDLIWARITPCMQNGKSAIVTGLVNGYGCGSTEFHVIRNANSGINLAYIQSLLRLPTLLKDAMTAFTGSAGQQRVPKSYLENLQIPLPPLTIQNEIVEHTNILKEQIANCKLQAKQLRVKALSDFEQKIFD